MDPHTNYRSRGTDTEWWNNIWSISPLAIFIYSCWHVTVHILTHAWDIRVGSEEMWMEKGRRIGSNVFRGMGYSRVYTYMQGGRDILLQTDKNPRCCPHTPGGLQLEWNRAFNQMLFDLTLGFSESYVLLMVLGLYFFVTNKGSQTS